MRALLQRVTHASVTVDGRVVGQIGHGLVVLLGVTHDDSRAQAAWLAKKVAGIRLFEDADGKMNLALADVGGELLVVSQFTLYGDARKGRRPSFIAAARPETAEPLVEYFIDRLRQHGLRVETGVFGAKMKVEIHNDGPVTLLVEK
ncbi:MAG: D-aminoacyl-tRNA deacylase [Anaerolineae bacterium]